MKKIIAIMLCTVMSLCVLAGCGDAGVKTDDKKLSVVVTVFPEYDWVREILGDKFGDAEVTMLLDSGVDLHSYQPTADDIIKVSTCDVFIYVGGESDEWVDGALAEATNKNMKVISLLEVLGSSVKEEEVVEGMEAEEEGGEEGGEEEPEYDEHVWLSLKNTVTLCEYIAAKLGEADTANAEIYSQNAKAYVQKLNELDAEYSSAVDAAAVKTILFGDRFPFRYLVDDYGITYYAAFVGCSAESEASFETVTFLANKVDELKLTAVLTLEGTEHKIAETIISNTQSGGQKILTMDSMQSTTSADVQAGTSYLSIMQKNLEVLKQALGTSENG